MSDAGLWFDHHRCSVTKNFSYTLHDFGRVIAQPDDGISAELVRMLQTEIKRVLPRFLAEVGQNGDVAANEGLQARSDRAEDREPSWSWLRSCGQFIRDRRVCTPFSYGSCPAFGCGASVSSWSSLLFTNGKSWTSKKVT